MFGQHLPNKCLFAGVESKVAFFRYFVDESDLASKKTASSITFGITTKKENPVVVFFATLILSYAQTYIRMHLGRSLLRFASF